MPTIRPVQIRTAPMMGIVAQRIGVSPNQFPVTCKTLFAEEAMQEISSSLNRTIVDLPDHQPNPTLDVGGSNRRTISTSTCPGLLGCGRFEISTKPCR
jgi:hypothetical protein